MSGRVAVRAGVAASAVALVACGGGGGAAPDRPRAAAPEIAVTRGAAGLPAECAPRRIAALLVDYLAEAGRGDGRAAARRFAPELASPHGWYSVSPGRPALPAAAVTATGRPVLARYLAARGEQHERMQLVEVVVNGVRAGLADLEFKLARTADDLGPSSGGWNTEGKGAVHCGRRRIAVWSMSTVPPAERTAPLCPAPRGGRGDGVVVACAARRAR